MKHYFLLLPLLFLFSCKNEREPFYRFDTIEHYHTDISDDQISALSERREHPTSNDLAFSEIFFEFYGRPKSVKDTEFMANLKRLYLFDGTVDKKYFSEINTIFSEKYENFDLVTSCEPEFRDVLVFKKNNKITGIAKICFSCGKSYLVGTDKNTTYFGAYGDFKKLRKLLNVPFK